jgi:PhnB protein
MADSVQPTPPGVVPYLTIAGAADAIEFYKRAFGANELMRMPGPGGKLMHASLELNGGMILLSDDFPEMNDGKGGDPKALGGSAVTIHLNLPDVDATWNQALAAGAEVVMPLETQFWGDRYGQVRDPFGHVWSLATPGEPRTPEEIQQAMAALPDHG